MASSSARGVAGAEAAGVGDTPEACAPASSRRRAAEPRGVEAAFATAGACQVGLCYQFYQSTPDIGHISFVPMTYQRGCQGKPLRPFKA